MSDPTPKEEHPFPAGLERRDLVLLAGLAVLALVVRVIHVLAMRESPYFDRPTMDMAYHVEWARAFAAGERFQEGPFFRAPLYPWLLGLLLKITGGSLLAARLLQALLGVATTVLTALLGLRVGGRLVGGVAGALAATSWVLVYFDGELLIPTLAVPLNLVALHLSLGLVERPAPRRAALAGAAWGVAALARPNVLLLVPALAGWLVLRARRPRRWAAGLALGLGSLAPILPITLYNSVVGGDTVLISTQAGVNLWIGNNPESDGSSAIVPGTRGGWWEGYYDSIALAEAAEGRPLRPSEVSGHYSRRALDWILSHPLDALRHLMWKLRLYVVNAELGNNLDVAFFAKHYDPLARLSPVRWDLLLGFGGLGLVLALRRAGPLFPLWGFTVVYSASVVAFFVCSRYRVPVLPVLMVHAGVAIAWLLERGRRRSWGSLAGGFALVIGLALIANLRPAALRPSAASGHMLLGQAALQDDRPGDAIAEFERALAADPAHPHALQGLAGAARRAGDLGRAERVLLEALATLEAATRATGRRSPGQPEMRAELVDVLVDANRLGEAEARASEWLAADRAQPLLLFTRARARAQGRRPQEAISDLEAALALDPRLVPAYDALELLLAALGRQDDLDRLRARRQAVLRGG